MPSNTLIDNSPQLKLVDFVKKFISDEHCSLIQIATGYWDLPGMALVQDELTAFFARGGRLDLLIGKEPLLRTYQLQPAYQKDHCFEGRFSIRQHFRIRKGDRPNHLPTLWVER